MKLKPCPFCGGEPRIKNGTDYMNQATLEIYCPNGCCGMSRGVDEEKKLVGYWNTRTEGE